MFAFDQLECRFDAENNPLPEGFAVNIDDASLKTQSLLQRIGERFSYYGARNAAVTFMAMHRFRRAGTVWKNLGKDVIVYLIGPMLYETRSHSDWHNADEIGWSQHSEQSTKRSHQSKTQKKGRRK